MLRVLGVIVAIAILCVTLALHGDQLSPLSEVGLVIVAFAAVAFLFTPARH